ncbi:hypothetical protein ScPMuIL_009794 [Solemya velum]
MFLFIALAVESNANINYISPLAPLSVLSRPLSVFSRPAISFQLPHSRTETSVSTPDARKSQVQPNRSKNIEAQPRKLPTMDTLLFVRIAAVVLGISLLLILVGLATDNWIETNVQDTHAGLWKVCSKSHCAKLHPMFITSALEATRAMVILSMLCSIVATVLCILWAIGLSFTEGKIIRMVAMATAFAAAAFGLLGIIIYAADMGPGLDLSWSFALTIVGSLGCGAAGGLLVPALSQTAA